MTGVQTCALPIYKSGFTAWCSSCHDLLATAAGSGHSADGEGLFRHAMDVSATIDAAYNTTTGAGIPLEGSVTVEGESTGLVTCMTCHRSHGTTAQMTGPLAESGISSALLRIDNRGVCFACHGAASTNTPGGVEQ